MPDLATHCTHQFLSTTDHSSVFFLKSVVRVLIVFVADDYLHHAGNSSITEPIESYSFYLLKTAAKRKSAF